MNDIDQPRRIAASPKRSSAARLTFIMRPSSVAGSVPFAH
jgi:hypothetical protein